MKEGIHPEYKEAKVVCACGTMYETRSTAGGFSIEVCAACHPFYTGKQKLMDTKGRVDKFNRKYSAKAPAPAAKLADVSRSSLCGVGPKTPTLGQTPSRDDQE